MRACAAATSKDGEPNLLGCRHVLYSHFDEEEGPPLELPRAWNAIVTHAASRLPSPRMAIGPKTGRSGSDRLTDKGLSDRGNEIRD